MTIPTLLHIPYSPWSERARWALDVRGVAYRSLIYQPLVGELGLRLRLRRWRGPVSVPVLLASDGVVAGSDGIARWADSRGSGPRLLPADGLDEIEDWVQRVDPALSSGRALNLARVLAHSDPTIYDEFSAVRLGKFVVRLGKLGAAMTRRGIARTMHKYDRAGMPLEQHQQRLVAALQEVRSALSRRSGDTDTVVPTLLSRFSYADIVASQLLAFVRPAAQAFFEMGPLSRDAMGDDRLADRFADLVEWRDQLLRRHRPPLSARVPAEDRHTAIA